MQLFGEKKNFGKWDVLEVDGVGFSISAIRKSKTSSIKDVFENPAQSEERIYLIIPIGNMKVNMISWMNYLEITFYDIYIYIN